MAWSSDSLNFFKVVCLSFSITAVIFQAKLLNLLSESLADKLSDYLFGDVPTNIFVVIRLLLFSYPFMILRKLSFRLLIQKTYETFLLRLFGLLVLKFPKEAFL